MLKPLSFLLLLTCWVEAQPRTLRTVGRILPSHNERRPAVATLQGKLFEARAKVYVTDENTVRMRVEIINLAGSQACYAMHGSVFEGGGLVLGSGGCNEVFHEKKKGQKSTQQWDFVVTPVDRKNLQTFQIVLYEDTVFVGRR